MYPPDVTFVKVMARKVASVGAMAETFTTFTLTGVAGIAALLLGNISNVTDIISRGGLKSGLIILTVSLFFGVVSKVLGMIVRGMLAMFEEVEATLFSKEGQRLMDSMSNLQNVGYLMASVYPWPVSLYIERKANQGGQDLLYPEKNCLRFFMFQILANALHWLTALAGITTLILSMT